MPKLWDSDWERSPAPIRRRRGFGDPVAGADQQHEATAAPRGGARRVWLGTLAALVLLGAGLVAGLVLHGDSGSSSTATELPAASGAPLTPTSVGRIYDRVSAGVASVRTNEGAGRASSSTQRHDRHQRARRRHRPPVEVRFDDKGDLLPAKVVGIDPSSDLAVLKLDSKPPTTLTALPLADSDACASATTRSRSATRSASSAPRRAGSSPASGARSRRPTASRSTRSSRPTRRSTPATPAARCSTPRPGHRRQLADRDGRRPDGNVGIGFAVPSNTVRAGRPAPRARRAIKRAYLGVSSASGHPRSRSCSAADTRTARSCAR